MKLKNENKEDEMICVLNKIMKYFPSHTTVDHTNNPYNKETIDLILYHSKRKIRGL